MIGLMGERADELDEKLFRIIATEIRDTIKADELQIAGLVTDIIRAINEAGYAIRGSPRNIFPRPS